MFNKLLQNKALGEGKISRTGSSSKCSSAKSPSTPASSAFTGDSKGKRQAEPISTPPKKTKASTAAFSPLAPKTSIRAGTPSLEDIRIKREKLHFDEVSSLLKEDSESNQETDFLRGLLSPPDKVFLGVLPRDQDMNSLASYVGKTALLVGDLLEHEGPAAEEAQRKVEELEKEMQEKECKHETNITHLKSKISSFHGRLDQAAVKL
ncbi:UNVERIFIED_CONTAM: hypothetical protein Sindi_1708500 [Sesamum indicum]